MVKGTCQILACDLSDAWGLTKFKKELRDKGNGQENEIYEGILGLFSFKWLKPKLK